MNHAEHAEKLLADYAYVQASDQAAIAHALLAINETLQSAAADLNIEVPPFDETEEGAAGTIAELESQLEAARTGWRRADAELRRRDVQ